MNEGYFLLQCHRNTDLDIDKVGGNGSENSGLHAGDDERWWRVQSHVTIAQHQCGLDPLNVTFRLVLKGKRRQLHPGTLVLFFFLTNKQKCTIYLYSRCGGGGGGDLPNATMPNYWPLSE